MVKGSSSRESLEMEQYPQEKRLKILHDVIEVGDLPRNLTNDVIDHIITFLPIQKATTTSILSKRFEESWQHCQNLCFDYWFAKKHSQPQIANIINRVLMLHSGKKIKNFHLYVNPYGLEPFIIPWIALVVVKQPQVLELDFISGKYNVEPYEIPFEILDVESITYLRLSYCLIHLPPKFKRLYFLHTLILRHISLNSCFVKAIFDNCLHLQLLDIVRCYDFRHIAIITTTLKFFTELRIGECYQLNIIYIDAPTLQIFHFVGKPRNVIFQGRMSQIKDVMIKFQPVNYILPRCKMNAFMRNISYIRVLTVSSTFLEDICSTFIHGVNVRGPQQYLWHLKEVQLFMETTSFCNPYDIVCFIDKCPQLERLFIDFQKFSFDGKGLYWELHDRAKFEHFDKQFPFLKLVKLSCFKFKFPEIKFVKFFLEKASNLENLAIFTEKKFDLEESSKFVKRVVRHMISWRSSPNAKVGVYEYYDTEDDYILPEHQDLWYSPYE